MNTLQDLLPYEWGDTWFGEFKPVCTYFTLMDSVLYLEEDVSYRAQWIDGCLSILLHPYEDRIVGVKVEGAAQLCREMRDTVHSKIKRDFPDVGKDDFARAIKETKIDFPLKSLITYAFLGLRSPKHEPSYRKAISFLDEKKVFVDPYQIIQTAPTVLS